MGEISVTTVYFEQPGPENTDRTLEIAKKRADELGIKDILVATTRGETGVKASRSFKGFNLIAVTHSTGFARPNFQELIPDNRKEIEGNGGRVLTCQHAFGGVGRAVRNKLGTYQLEELIAYTLRTFGQGMKVAVEIVLMAIDAGLVPTDREVISIGGTNSGADTAVLVQPANAAAFFDLRVKEILCKPRF